MGPGVVHKLSFLLCVACLGLLVGCGERGDATRARVVDAADQPAGPNQRDRTISYNRDIRPILSDKCFACHGPDSAAREAELRLDTPDDGEGYFGAMLAIVPGDPEASELVSRVHSSNSRIVMPPPSFKVTLTDAEKALLVQWIEQGAEYEPHWSFVPVPRDVAPPAVENEAWVRDGLDRFVLARLEAEGLPPSKEASRTRWLRRVTLDLTGLPPTPEEIEAFLKDDGEDAHERVVDRLLASQHYGEHMAARWSDLARYADSYGYQSDQLSPNWPWRDWLIRAFNDNLPYDRFLTEQLAGDLLPNPTRDQRLATAFNRLHRMTNEGGSISEEWLNEYAADRVHTFGTVFMGLTLECARCHDHKYDPIEQSEYYELYAYFNSIDEHGMYMHQRNGFVPTPTVLLPDRAQDEQWQALKRKAEQAEQAYVRARESRSGQPFQDWLASYIVPQDRPLFMPGAMRYYALNEIAAGNKLEGFPGDTKPASTHPANKLVEGKHGKALQFAGDTHVTFETPSGIQPDKPFSASMWVRLPRRFDEALLLHNSSGTDAGFNGSWITVRDGRLRFVMARFWPGNAIAVQTKEELPVGEWVHLTLTYDATVSAKGMAIYVNGEPASEVLRDNLTKHHGHRGNKLVFDSRMRTSTMPGAAIDEVRLFDRALTPIEARHWFDGRSFDRAIEARDAEALKSYYLEEVDTEAVQAKRALIEARNALLQFQTGLLEVSVMEDRPEPTPAYNLDRGAYDAPKTEDNRVYRATPDALPAMPKDAPNNRLGLAKWLADPSHPLTARVAANRLWAQCFGNGLVGTPDDFGMQGDLPTHPELLDYLARQYIASGWDTKAMLKRIVLSATYRQDSSATPERWAGDPGNALLARGPARRLSAEMLRDTALAASGLMHDKLGGPPVAPYQPPKLWREANAMSPAYRQSVGQDLYRRSLYTVWKRTAPMPNMLAFDAPTREVCTAERSSTNTPMQALVLLNDVQFVEACRVLAERALKAEQDDTGRLDRVFTSLAGRKPDARERELLMGLLERQRAYYAGTKTDAQKLRSQGEMKIDETLDDAEVAAWTSVVQAVMNADATVWRR
ncbi:MAG: DUF1553 domain-containing protein [Phycisphaeraceae bacterium]